MWIILWILWGGKAVANRRMFSLNVVDTDAFLDLPISSQALYFHLGMRADDDGFVSSPKKVTAMIGANQDDLKLLIAKGFAIALENGIVVIRHWRQNNYVRSDRYKKTIYSAALTIKFFFCTTKALYSYFFKISYLIFLKKAIVRPLYSAPCSIFRHSFPAFYANRYCVRSISSISIYSSTRIPFHDSSILLCFCSRL